MDMSANIPRKMGIAIRISIKESNQIMIHMKNRMLALWLFMLIALNLCAQSPQTRKGFLSFNEAQILYGNDPRFSPKMAWYSSNPAVKVDNETLCSGQSSLLIPSTSDKATDVHFYFSNRDIVGKKIRFTGKYKYKQADRMSVRFSIVLDTFLRRNLTESITADCKGEEDWKEFSVEMPLARTSIFYFRIASRGEGTLWLSDCQVFVDGQSWDILEKPTLEADKDREFMENSGIQTLPTDKQAINNLEVLGKVWGFLKYFHPQVTAGTYNWDFELFRILPRIAAAKDRRARNQLLSQWIDQYGEITETEDYTVEDSTQYHRFAYLGWLEDPNLFDSGLSAKLVKIKNAKRNSVFNYYLPQLTGKEEIEFVRDKPYPNVSWEDLGYRILTAYRMWNAIEYSFPYRNLTDTPWSTVLAKYLPEFITTASEEQLDRSMQKLAAEINDSHGGLVFRKFQPSMRGLPLGLTQTVDGKFAVRSTWLQEIERGSVILRVKGKTVEEIVEEYRPIIPASNERTLLRDVAPKLFLTPDKETSVRVKFDGRVYNKEVPTQTFTMRKEMERKKPEEYYLSARGIIYINMGEIQSNELEQLMRNSAQAKGLILDLRKYPKGFTKDMMEKYLYPQLTPYMWFSMNSKKYPGNYFLDIKGDVGMKENPDYFKGKIAILVNEGTQSFGELSAIAFRVAPRSAVIGTQTAGANGHIGYLFLPRGIRFNYTMAGAFYPNWGMNQRVGVRIDIPVKQTVQDVVVGDDKWIMEAVDYIESAE